MSLRLGHVTHNPDVTVRFLYFRAVAPSAEDITKNSAATAGLDQPDSSVPAYASIMTASTKDEILIKADDTSDLFYCSEGLLQASDLPAISYQASELPTTSSQAPELPTMSPQASELPAMSSQVSELSTISSQASELPGISSHASELPAISSQTSQLRAMCAVEDQSTLKPEVEAVLSCYDSHGRLVEIPKSQVTTVGGDLSKGKRKYLVCMILG